MEKKKKRWIRWMLFAALGCFVAGILCLIFSAVLGVNPSSSAAYEISTDEAEISPGADMEYESFTKLSELNLVADGIGWRKS